MATVPSSARRRRPRAAAAVLLAALALAPVPAAAITVGDRYATQFGQPGEVDRYRIRLVRGQDYAVGVRLDTAPGGLRAVLRDPRGRVLASFAGAFGREAGAEVRAVTTGTHVLEFTQTGAATLPTAYAFRVFPDCRGGPTTTCNLNAGAPQVRQLGFGADVDWLRLSVRAGRPYTVDVATEGARPQADLVDGRGRVVLAGGRDQHVSFFLRVGAVPLYLRVAGRDPAGGGYRVSLTAE